MNKRPTTPAVINTLLATCFVLGLLSCTDKSSESEEKVAVSSGALNEKAPAPSPPAIPSATTLVRLCHQGQIIEVNENALKALLDQGAVLAPEESVKTDADCLVPHTSTTLASAGSTTDRQGMARFVLPKTNIRFAVRVADANEDDQRDINVALLAIGNEYLLVAYDSGKNPTFAPGIQEGTLSDIPQGMSPEKAINIELQSAGTTPDPTMPAFITRHFGTISDDCLSESELTTLLSEYDAAHEGDIEVTQILDSFLVVVLKDGATVSTFFPLSSTDGQYCFFV